MKRRGMCILLTLMLCASIVCTVSAATPDVPEATDIPPTQTNQQDPEESSDAKTAEATASLVFGAELPDGAAPYESDTAGDAPSEDGDNVSADDAPADTSNILYTVGSGEVEVRDGGSWVPVTEWLRDAELPASNVEFRAVPTAAGEEVTGVSVDRNPVQYTRDTGHSGAWLFAVDEVTDETAIVVSFGNTIPGVMTVVGPGTAWILAGDEWVEIPEEQPEFEDMIGNTVSIMASPDLAGHAALQLWVGNTPVAPTRYTAKGTVFEFVAEGPMMDLALEFEPCNTITVDATGEGTLSLLDGGRLIPVDHDAVLPYDAAVVSEDTPLAFQAVPADGYVMGQVTFNGTVIVALDGRELGTHASASLDASAPADTASPLPEAEGEDGQAPVLVREGARADRFVFALAEPENEGVLRVPFVPSASSNVEWLRGSDAATGISWAVPLGTSVYGTSNVTAGSTIMITALTQGTQYEQARTLAARFGSAFKAWDFTLLNAQGVAYEPSVPTLFSLPIPPGYPQNAQYLRMLHIRSDGQLMECPLEVRTDQASGMVYLATRADSLSTFILVNTLSASSGPTAVPTYPGSVAGGGSWSQGTQAPVGSTSGTVPKTYDESPAAVLWLCVVAAAAAFVICSLWLRRSFCRD